MDDVKSTTVYSNTLSKSAFKWSPGFETMYNHWSDLQKSYEVQWRDRRIIMIAVERPKLVTTVQKPWKRSVAKCNKYKHMKLEQVQH